MLRRFITILVLLTIVFFIYRKFNPVGAEALVNKVRTTYSRILGRTGDMAVITGDVAPASGGLLDNVEVNEIINTGIVQQPTGATVLTSNVQTPPPTITPVTTTTKPIPLKAGQETKATQNLINSLFK